MLMILLALTLRQSQKMATYGVGASGDAGSFAPFCGSNFPPAHGNFLGGWGSALIFSGVHNCILAAGRVPLQETIRGSIG